jgi:hypothetical protein
MGQAKLKKGDQVLVNVPPQQNNGDPEAVGTVVRVLETEGSDDSDTRCNVKVHLDGDSDLLLRNVPVLTKTAAGKDDAPTKRAVRV